MPKPRSGIPEDKLALYDRLVATIPDIERKGATTPYTSLNGNMFTVLSPPGSLGIRLPPAERARFVDTYGTGLHQAHGTVMKEYVRVPDELLARTEELRAWFELSYEYAKTLKPKPTKRAN
jgi:hypothetical protein